MRYLNLSDDMLTPYEDDSISASEKEVQERESIYFRFGDSGRALNKVVGYMGRPVTSGKAMMDQSL